MKTITFGELMKEYRQKTGRTLREFCHDHGFDAANVSRFERGVFPPPQKTELLEKYAAAYGIKRGTDEWTEFFDLASVGRGEIPSDLLSDEELVKKLPVLFRTLRGTAVPAEKLDALVERIRGA